jgi:hypothetical protein
MPRAGATGPQPYYGSQPGYPSPDGYRSQDGYGAPDGYRSRPDHQAPWDGDVPEPDPAFKYREPGPGMPGYRGSRDARYGGDRR